MKHFGTSIVYMVIFAICIAFLPPFFSGRSVLQTSAQTLSQNLNFQGKIVNKTAGTNLDIGNPACMVNGVDNDTCDFKVNIYDAAVGGTLKWSEVHGNVELEAYNGVFSLELNSICNSWTNPADAISGANQCIGTGVTGIDWALDNNLYVEIQFDPSGTSNFVSPETFSRKRLTGVPYAQFAQSANSLDGVNKDGFVQLQPDNIQTGTNTNPLVWLDRTGGGTSALMQLRVGGNDRFLVDNDGNLTISGDSMVGGGNLNISGTEQSALVFAGLPSWYLGTLSGTSPLINYDANDYTTYDRANNSLNTFINGTNITSTTSTGLNVIGGITATSNSTIFNHDFASNSIELNANGTGNRNAFVDFHGDDTYTDYGLRIIRESTGVNANSLIAHRGTGSLVLNAQDGGQISFYTGGAAAAYISTNRELGLAAQNNLGEGGQLVLLGSTGYNNWWIDSNLNNLRILSNSGVNNELLLSNVGAGVTELDVEGAVKIGNSTSNEAGKIRWTGTDFEGYDGSTWKSLTAGSSVNGNRLVYTPENTPVIRRGWGYIQGNDNYALNGVNVGYGVTYDTIPSVSVTAAGFRGSIPASLAQCVERYNGAGVSANAYSVGTGSFWVDYLGQSYIFSSARYFCYSWISIGPDGASYGADLAENFLTHDTSLRPGEIVAIDENGDIAVRKSNGEYDAKAFGVVSTAPGQVLGNEDGTSEDRSTLKSLEAINKNQELIDKGLAKVVPVALEGRVPVRVSLENGPIKAGDYLTPASKPGYAMKATKPGITIGRALEDFNETTPSIMQKGDEGYEEIIQALDEGKTMEEIDMSSLGINFDAGNNGEGQIMVLVEKSQQLGEGDESILSKISSLHSADDRQNVYNIFLFTVILTLVVAIIRHERKIKK